MTSPYLSTTWRTLVATMVAGLIAWVPARLFSQTIIIDQPVYVVPVNSLSINDVDFTKATSPKLLFTIGLRTSDGSAMDVYMELLLEIPAFRKGDNVLYMKTKPFSVPGGRIVTNLDFGKSIPLEENRIESEARTWLERVALPSGTVPAGNYDFRVYVTPVRTGGNQSTGAFSIVLSNPSSVELVYPGDGEELSTRFPMFQWRYDGRSRISIYEKLDTQTSLEEATSGPPLVTEVSPTQSFQYPSAGARQLLPGRTYVWFVEGLSAIAGGTDALLKSALRSFTIVPEGAPGTTPSALLDELEQALGPKYRGLIDQLRAGKFEQWGSMRLNGRVITMTELLRVLGRIRLNPELIHSVELE